MTDSEKRSRRWRRTRTTALVAALAAAGIALLVRTPAPIGHWDDAAGQDRFRAAYDTAFAALPAPARTLDIRTGYGLVRVYRFTGERSAARPFVLLPGRASATPVWAANLPGLLALGDVYTVDLLGEPGLSIQERPITGDADHAAWLHETLAALPEDAFHLVGLSIGGWTAVNLALHDPAQIATLTLIDPVHVFDDLPLGTIVRSLPAALPWLPKSWRDGFNSYTAGGAPVEDEPVAAMIEAGMRHYRLELPAPTRIAEDRLAELRPPVLAIIAGRSVMHDPGTAVATAERALPGGTVRVYPDASHALNGEYPERIAADIAEFTGTRP
ncbi:alpha/beta fold hydrolase [Nocardia asteroides]|uniref:alpha/beta fold hydrolase n=1 Tax=Nocardia asteroides TaxID=1824 RepID=UPI001E50ED13|nr:alpha/beta hydrolase [Nocardia asteroides]UGT61753.1 alpha/beta hydrolase [Nocardia asteroides]